MGEIDVVSPSGTRSNVLSGRFQDDDSSKGFNNWKFMSVHFWGENPKGTWKVHARNRSLNDSEDMLEERQDSYLGNNLEQQNVELNKETSWNDLVGGKFLVRQDNNLF